MATGTLTYDEVCEKACDKTSIEPSLMKADVTEYMKKAQELLLMGYRVPLGDQFLFIYPSINVSVKDEVTPNGRSDQAGDSRHGEGGVGHRQGGCNGIDEVLQAFRPGGELATRG